MTRFSEEWFDRKQANIAEWKRREAERSANQRELERRAWEEKVRAWAEKEFSPKADAARRRSTRVVADAASRAPINTTVVEWRPDGAGTTTRTGAAGAVVSSVTTPAAGAPKYRNQRTNGYASKREARRAGQLRLMQEAGQIRNLREHVAFLLIPTQKRPDRSVAERSCSYVADFTYEEWTADGWRRVVEDVKGMRTEVYRIKRKLMLFVHGIEIREV